ncbi:restriction endonuclease [Ramlibacter sp. PS3R-8]|uniref:restriction endonuclease n=1 Tax=Ramlibacter sp. PS3R-8 TaxID=3133437 RepID=UPI003095A6D6
MAKLPWWVALGAGAATWLLFHRLAMVQPDTAGLARRAVVGSLTSIVVPTLSGVLQYLVPTLCAVAAFISWWGRRTRTGLVSSVTRSPSADVLNGMSWREFEMLVGEGFRMQGYAVVDNGGSGPDGGVDLTVRKGDETYIVQCKQWKAFKVDVGIVRELYGVMAARGAAGGFVVTSGSFTKDAIEFAQGRNVKLMDGKNLYGFLKQAKTSTAGRTATQGPGQPEAPVGSQPTEHSTACPVCSASMVRRVAKNGPRAGSQFWGCSTFPRCRGTR